MTNPFADSQANVAQQQQQFEHPQNDSTGAAVDFNFPSQQQPMDQKLADAHGKNPFVSSVNWEAAGAQQVPPQPAQQQPGAGFDFPPIQGQAQVQLQQDQVTGNLFDFDGDAAAASQVVNQNGVAQPQAQANANLFDFPPVQQANQPAAGSSQNAAGGLDDIMAAFDAGVMPQQPPLVAEKSAFDDDDGDLGSDEDDGPQIGQMGGSAFSGQTKNLSGLEMGSMSIRQQYLVEEQKESISIEMSNSRQSALAPVVEAGDKEGAPVQVNQSQAIPQQQQQQPQVRQLPADITEAQEAFPDMDLAIIKELYIQSGKSKAVLFEMLFQMANPEAANPEDIQNALAADDQAESEEEREAQMIAAMAGMQMGGDHGPMTQQELDDMRMAQQLQERYVQRAQRESQVRQNRGSQNQSREQQMQRERHRQAQIEQQFLAQSRMNAQQPPQLIQDGRQQPDMRAQDQMSEASDDWQFRANGKDKKKGIKKDKEAGESKGFFANLFGCCTSKKAPPKAAAGAKKPEQKQKPQKKEKKQKQPTSKQEEVKDGMEDQAEISL